MGRGSLAPAAVLAGLLLTCATAAFADDLPGCTGSVYLTVTPPQPECNETVILGATQVLTDSCWTATPPFFSDVPPDFSFELTSIDLWQPSVGCTLIILEIPFTRQIGPLPPGPYSLAVQHTSTSPRFGDAACADWIPFEVTCCAEVPPEATSLQVDKATAGTEAWLRWLDVPGADDYVVYGADEPDGPFTRALGSATNGSAGAMLPVDALPGFFVVAARNGCGVGARR